MKLRYSMLVVLQFGWAVSAPVLGQVQTFPNNYAGFLQAAGSVRTIDFETLPDGTPSDGHQGTPITGSFNYDLQGAHFSTPVSYPYIAGPGPPGGIDLRASLPGLNDRTWIITDLVAPGRAVGAFFPGHTQLCALDAQGAQLGCVAADAPGSSPGFVGLVSSSQHIARVINDRGSNGEDIASFVFAPVPEPGTAALVAIGLGWAVRPRRRRTLSA